jgi:hypothetical protein
MEIVFVFVRGFMWVATMGVISIFAGPMLVNKILGNEESKCQIDNKLSFHNKLQMLATIIILLFAVIVLCLITN